MTLGYIYVCCDDGETYTCDYVNGDVWAISFEEFRHDELWVNAGPRPKGQPRDTPRPVVDPNAIITKHELPIARVRFISHQHYGGRDVAVYRIEWHHNRAFPRKLLPADYLPKTQKNLGEGTYCCSTRIHEKRRIIARQEALKA